MAISIETSSFLVGGLAAASSIQNFGLSKLNVINKTGEHPTRYRRATMSAMVDAVEKLSDDQRAGNNRIQIPGSFESIIQLGFIPLRFIVASLLPRLPRPVDGEIRAKNLQGERKYEKARPFAGLFFMRSA